MIDMKPTIEAKSDQLNADDLVAGPVTIKITGVNVGSGADQPINIRYENDKGKPFKPCKTVRRVLVHAWGDDGSKYVGRYLTIFRDPSVKWAGQEVGGIRISHMSHIDRDFVVPLTVTRGKKAPVTIKKMETPQEIEKISITDQDFQSWASRMDQAQNVDELKQIGGQIAQFTDKYDADSINRLKAYYSDILTQLK